MWNRKDLKEQGKHAFKKNYWPCVLVSLILSILTGAMSLIENGVKVLDSDSFENIGQSASLSVLFLYAFLMVFIIVFIVTLLLQIFVFNILIVGVYQFFINNNRYERGQMGDLVSGFKGGHYLNICLTIFLKDLFLVLWTLLFIIPGIVKGYSYRMVPYIIAEDPTLKPTEAISRSRRMMDGQKLDVFILDLSFLGWIILGVITLGIVDIFYVNPYRNATDAALYDTLKYKLGENAQREEETAAIIKEERNITDESTGFIEMESDEL